MPEAKSQFLSKIIEGKGPDTEEHTAAYTKERQHTAQAFALHVDYRDGLSSEGVAWSHFGRYHWRDLGTHESLRIIFGGMCGMEITGHNLQLLLTDVRSGQLNGIKEMLSGQVMLAKPESVNNALITSVKAYPNFDALFEEIKQEGQEEELETLEDADLRAIIGRAEELLRKHDEERKAKAMNEARALLASVGLSLKDLNGKAGHKATKGLIYKGGHVYQHPSNKMLTWNAKGKKPGWLTALEAERKTAVEIANLNAEMARGANDNMAPKKVANA